MTTDIYFNGTQYPDRTGNDKFGTFYRQVQPPSPSGGSNFILSGQAGTLNLDFEDSSSGFPFYNGWTNNFNGGSNPWIDVGSPVHGGTRGLKVTLQPTSNPAFMKNDERNKWGGASGNRYRIVEFYVYGTAGWQFPYNIYTGGSELGSGTYTATNTNTWELVSGTFGPDTNGTLLEGIKIFAGTNAVAGAGSIAYFDDVTLKSIPASAGGPQTMDTNWGGRVAENTGRVRGISLWGTIPANGTYIGTFPVGFFNFIPLMDVRVLRQTIRLNVNGDRNLTGVFMTDSWNATRKGSFSAANIGGDYTEPRPVPVIRQITAGSFVVVAYWTPETPRDCVVSVHAWGV